MTVLVGDEEIVLLDKKDVAKLLGVTASTVWNYIRRGALPAQMIGGRWYVTEPNLMTFLNGRTAISEEAERSRRREVRKRSGLRQNRNIALLENEESLW